MIYFIDIKNTSKTKLYLKPYIKKGVSLTWFTFAVDVIFQSLSASVYLSLMKFNNSHNVNTDENSYGPTEVER